MPLVAPLIVRTGEPVLPVGGFFGREEIVPLKSFEDMARRGEIRYVLIPQSLLPQGEFTNWVLAHGEPVEVSQWRSRPPGPRVPTLFELKMEKTE